MRRCLVIGGGLIGGHVARHLVDNGHHVTLFTRGFNPWLDEQRLNGIDVRRGSVGADRDVLARLIARAECVLHFASSSRPPSAARAPADDLCQTVLPALAVLEELGRAGEGRKLVISSSGGTVYGRPIRLPTPESHPLAPTTPYAISHATVERYVAFFTSSGAFDANVLRFPNVYGPGETGRGGQGVIGSWLHAVADGLTPQLLGPTSTRRDFLYVGDAAAAVEAVIARGRPGVTYNVGSGRSHTLAEVLATICRVTGAQLLPVATSTLHTTGGIPETWLDSSLVERDTGWRPEVELEEGVARAWRWVRSERAHGAAPPLPLVDPALTSGVPTLPVGQALRE